MAEAKSFSYWKLEWGTGFVFPLLTGIIVGPFTGREEGSEDLSGPGLLPLLLPTSLIGDCPVLNSGIHWALLPDHSKVGQKSTFFWFPNSS